MLEADYKNTNVTGGHGHMFACIHQLSYLQKCHAFATELILDMESFAEKWGLEMIPTDLRLYDNNIWISIGLPSNYWTPLIYMHTDFVHTPEDTDGLGDALV